MSDSARADLSDRRRQRDRAAREAPAAGSGGTGASAILSLQRSVGNRAVTRLLWRQAAATEQKPHQNVGQMAPEADKTRYGVGSEAVEWENLGPFGKFMDDAVEMHFERLKIHSRFVGLFAKAWDVYELVQFARTRELEYLGAPAATVAAKIANAAERKIEQGAATRYTYAAYVGGRAYLVAWTTYEAYKFGTWMREIMDSQGELEDLARDRWRSAMMQQVWVDYMRALADEREQTFDLIMGGTMSYGQVPGLTNEAFAASLEIVNDASDRWKPMLHLWQEAAVYLAQHDNQDTNDEWAVDVMRTSPKDLITGIVGELADDFARLRDFHNDPANWKLTEEQQELLRTSHEIGPWTRSPKTQ